MNDRFESPFPNIDVWHRRTCWIADTAIALSGDLPSDRSMARHHLASWVDDGITHIIDVRSEDNDAKFVAHHQPHVGYTWLGIDDDGHERPDAWFDHGVAAGMLALARPGAGLMVHCSMGMQRGPSMGFAIMLVSGWDPIVALDAIVAARPIAEIQYAGDAVSWWHRRSNTAEATARKQRRAVESWLSRRRAGSRWHW